MATLTFPVEVDWGYGHGSPGANVWHLRTTATEGDLGGLSDIIQAFYEDIAGLYNTTTTIKYLGEATGLGDDADTTFTSDPWTVTGTDSGSVAPPMLALLCQWRADTGGRSGRGRTFIGPLAAAAVGTDGTPNATQLTAIRDAAAALVDSSDSFGNGAVGIYSRVDGVIRDITTSSVPDDFAVMRSRRD
jgi:hypothetical protein